MTNKPELPTTIELLETETSSEQNQGRKSFIEPELSSPIDVLEATTFLQVGPDSGVI